MKPKSTLHSVVACPLVAALAISCAHAADFTWNGLATGTWDTTATNWTGASGTPWDSANSLTNSATFNLASLNAMVSGTVYTRGISFNTGGTLSGGTITLGTSGINAGTLTSGTTTISSNLSLVAGGQTWTTGAGSTLAVNGTVTRAAGTVLTLGTTGSYTSSSIANVNSIVGPWAFVGTGSSARYATVSGGSLAAYTGGTSQTGFNWTSPGLNTVNYDVSGVGNIGNNRTANTVRYTGAAGTQTLGSGASDTLLTLNGLMNVGSGTLTLALAGSITGSPAVIIGANNNEELVLNAAASDITINVPINNNGATKGTVSGGTASSVAITGGDGRVVTFGGANLYTGSTTVGGGALRLGSGNALPGGIAATGGTANLLLNGGYVEMAFDNFARALGTGAAQVQITGGTSGFSARGAARTVNLGGASAALTWGSASFNPSTLVLNGTTANNTLDFQNPIDLGASARTVFSGANTATFSGILSGTGASLVKTGSGTLTLTALNTFTGGTTVNGGNLLLNYNSTDDAAVRGTVTVNTGATLTVSGPSFGGFGTNAGSKINTLDVVGGSVVVSGDKMNKDATFNLTGGTISGGKIHWRNSALNSLASASTSTVSSEIMIRNDYAVGVPLTIDVADGGAAKDLVISGVISQPFSPSASVVKSGAGTLELTNYNTYTGATTVNAGKLLVTGNISNSTLTTVKNTGTLGGGGFVGTVSVESGGIIAPGSSAGNLTVSNGLTIAGIYQWELAALSTANPGTNFDRITLTTGNADITGAALGLNLGAFTPTAIPFWQIDQTWAGILNNTGAGSLTGSFAAIDNTTWSSLGSFSTTYTGNDVNLVWTAVPEPSVFLTGGVLATAGLLRRRRTGKRS